MAKTKPSKKQPKKKNKSALHGTRGISSAAPKENPVRLFEQATNFLQTGQPVEALSLVERALTITSTGSQNHLIGLNLCGEVHVELGDIDAARRCFMQAVDLDPRGEVDDSIDGGAEKFLWLAQLSEEGGHDSVRWFERGAAILKHRIQSIDGNSRDENHEILEELKKRLAHALCGTVEIYMTDLSWEEDAESRCEILVTEALLVAPNAPECLQTLASIRISQLRQEDARAALKRSLELWRNLAPENALVPDFPARISLARLLMEVEMETEALQVLERMVLEDNQSIETWYLGGWCHYLLGTKPQTQVARDENPNELQEQHLSILYASRVWLKQSLKLYEQFEYEDEKLKAHAMELVQQLDQEIGISGEDDSEVSDEGDWEDASDHSDSGGDQEMADT
ncbi:hypothetical protein FQN57_000422 [Myotisia sp. PD_48]|nr:hypothetical protein FQN57_000422 [Myotisia sp. PD_48]